MKRLIASSLVLLVSGWASSALAQSKGGGVSSGDTSDGAPVKKAETEHLTADERFRLSHKTSYNDGLYDAIANLSAPRRDRVMPWVVGLSLGALVMFMGLKHSFRNRYEG